MLVCGGVPVERQVPVGVAQNLRNRRGGQDFLPPHMPASVRKGEVFGGCKDAYAHAEESAVASDKGHTRPRALQRRYDEKHHDERSNNRKSLTNAPRDLVWILFKLIPG